MLKEIHAPSTPVLTPLPGTNLSVEDIDAEFIPLPPSLNPSTVHLDSAEPGYFDIFIDEQPPMDNLDELEGPGRPLADDSHDRCIHNDDMGAENVDMHLYTNFCNGAENERDQLEHSNVAPSIVAPDIQYHGLNPKQGAGNVSGSVRTLDSPKHHHTLPFRPRHNAEQHRVRKDSVVNKDCETCNDKSCAGSTSAQTKGTLENSGSPVATTDPVPVDSRDSNDPARHKTWGGNVGLYDGSGYGGDSSGPATPCEPDEGIKDVHMLFNPRTIDALPAARLLNRTNCEIEATLRDHDYDSLESMYRAHPGFAPSVASLGALSFGLHKELAEKYHGRQTWGYAQSTGISLSQDSESAILGSGEDWLENGTSRAQLAQGQPAHNRPWEENGGGQHPEWLRRTKDATMEVISRDGTTAQIDPLRFCKWLKSRVEERGVRIIHPAAATEVLRDGKGVLSGVRIVHSGDKQSQDLPCTRLLIASGAWSPRVFSTLFPTAHTRIPISSLAGHSLLVRNPCFNPQAELDAEVCHAVFATDTLGFSPEWFARIGGELYLAGLNSTTIPLPEIATDVVASEKAIEQLKSCARVMMLESGAGKDIEVLRQGLCFRPVTSSGRPLVSRIPDEKLGGVKTRGSGEGGVFIAAGHGAWGISHAPGTGLVLAELMEGRPTSAKIETLRLPS
ncbi:hypothetical protein E8E13_005865 [Curvularia kusanoi]|uniref:FAD dependent oxidoreductase domain-containing protein n=1 Tax=Curvularia kusanoi TaxID=90978 RepID=A0A9P4T927_CURKU|nr:hypothetical protein E8E13_005865 [Curvularia kusanoi]